MKKKKYFIYFSVFVLGSFIVLYLLSQRPCKVDGIRVCYDIKESVFLTEENETLHVQVESEQLKEYLESVWDEASLTTLIIDVKAPLSLEELKEDNPYDIFITSSNNAAFMINDAFDLGRIFNKMVLNKSPSRSQGSLNYFGTYFVPNSIKGWLFVYNETIAKNLNLDLEDSDNFGLPDSFDSWEKIFELEPILLEDLNYVFPLTFVDQVSFYPFLTGGNWLLNFTNVGTDPGFNTPEFLKSLELIKDFGEVKWNKKLKTQTAEDLKWNIDKALLSRKSMFGMVTDWMYFDYHKEKLEDNFVYAPFPKFHDNVLSPLAKVDGYMVKKDVNAPSAAAEVLRLLREPEAYLYYESVDDKVFLYHRDFLEELKAEPEMENRIRAYNYSSIEPVMVLEDSPTVLARNLYYEVDFMPILRDVFDGKLTLEEAQEQFVLKAEAWRLENGSGIE